MYKSYISKTIGLILIIVLIFIIGRNILFDKVEYQDSQDDIYFSGRWFTKDIDGKEMHIALNQGAMLYFAVEGTEVIDVYFHDLMKIDTPYFAYCIDDGDMIRQKITEKSIYLPDKEEHEITIVIDAIYPSDVRWNFEHGVGFEKIDCYDGKIYKVDKDKKKVLYFGDSITEGVMSIGFVGKSEDNSAINSYTWLSAKQLDVEPYFLAYGGIGVSEKGSFTYASEVLDNLSSTRKAEEIPKCDLIIFNIGSNDVNILSEEFIKKYQEIVLDLHERFPDINIVCITPINQRHVDDIKMAVEDYNWCYVAETAEWGVLTSDGTHPIGEWCRIMADKLVEFIEENNLLE